MCSSRYDSTNEIATNKRLFTMIISSRGFTKHGHGLHKHIFSSNISLNNVKEVKCENKLKSFTFHSLYAVVN